MIFSLPTKTLSEWNSEDAKLLRDLLENSTFGKAIAFVLDQAPKLLDGSDVNKTLVASGKVDGYNEALQNLFRLTHEQPPTTPESEAYPSLDDESKWDKTTNEPRTP